MERPLANRCHQCGFDIALSHMQSPQLMPIFGVTGEISIGLTGPVSPHFREACPISREDGVRWLKTRQNIAHQAHLPRILQAKESPGPFAVTFHQARIHHQLEMTRHPRL